MFCTLLVSKNLWSRFEWSPMTKAMPILSISIFIIHTVCQQVSSENLITRFSHFCSFSGLCHPSKSNGAETHPEGGILWDFSLCFCKSNYTSTFLLFKHSFTPTMGFITLNHFVLFTLMLYWHLCIIQRKWKFWNLPHIK